MLLLRTRFVVITQLIATLSGRADWQFANEPTRGLSGRGLVNSSTATC